jgi:hypothetical protein
MLESRPASNSTMNALVIPRNKPDYGPPAGSVVTLVFAYLDVEKEELDQHGT